jgi:hypothetical protein
MADNELPDLDDSVIKDEFKPQAQDMQPGRRGTQSNSFSAPSQQRPNDPIGYRDRSGSGLPDLDSSVVRGPGTAEGLPEDDPETLDQVYEYFKSPQGQRMALEVAGGTAAGLVAPQVAIPSLMARFGPRVGQVAYRALQSSGMLRTGAMAGQSAVGSAGGSLAAEAVDPSGSFEAAARRAGESGVYGAAGSVASDAIGLAGRTAFQPFRRAMDPESVEVNKMLRRETGESMTPGQLTTGGQTGVDQLESIARAGFFSGGMMENTSRRAAEAAEGLANRLARDWVTTVDQENFGSAMKQFIQGQADAHTTTAQGFFNQLGQMAGDSTVDIQPLKRRATELLAQKQRGLKSSQLKSTVDQILNKDDAVDFGTAQELRSDLLAVTRVRDEPVGGKVEGAAKEMAKTLDSKMEEAARAQGDEVLRKWREANEFWKQGKEKFNSNFMKGLLQTDDPKVLNTIFDPDNPQRLRQVREMVGTGPAWQEVKGHWIKQQLGRASNNADQRLSGESLMRSLNNWTQENNNALKEMFSDQEIDRIRKVFQSVQKAQAPHSTRSQGAIALNLMQAGALGSVLGLASGSIGVGAAAGAGTLLMAPRTLARLMTSRMGHKYLTEGFKAPPGSRQARRVFGQIVSHMQNDRELEAGKDYSVVKGNPGNPLTRDTGERSDNQGQDSR